MYVACGKRQPNLLSVDVGISVGWKNRHAAGKHGQMIDLTGLPDGTYRLVQRVNSTRRLKEANFANNASSVLLSLVHAGATPSVKLLEACPDTPTSYSTRS